MLLLGNAARQTDLFKHYAGRATLVGTSLVQLLQRQGLQQALDTASGRIPGAKRCLHVPGHQRPDHTRASTLHAIPHTLRGIHIAAM